MKQTSGSTSSSASPTSPTSRINKRKSRRDRLAPYGEGISSSPMSTTGNAFSFKHTKSEGFVDSARRRPDSLHLSFTRRRASDGTKHSGKRVSGGRGIRVDADKCEARSLRMCDDSSYSEDSPTPLFPLGLRARSSLPGLPSGYSSNSGPRCIRRTSDCSSDSALGDDMYSLTSPATSVTGTPDFVKDFLGLAVDSPLQEDVHIHDLSERSMSIPCARKTIFPSKLTTTASWDEDRLCRSPLSPRSEHEDTASSDVITDQSAEAAPRYARSLSVPIRSSVRIRLFSNESTMSLPSSKPARHLSRSPDSSAADLGDHTLLADASVSPQPSPVGASSPMCTSPFLSLLTKPGSSSGADKGLSPLPGLSSLLSAPLLSGKQPMDGSFTQSPSLDRFLSLPPTLDQVSLPCALDNQVPEDLRQTPSPCSSRPCFPVDNDATPRLHSVTRGSSCPGLGSIYHVTSLSTNALLSDDGQASSSIQPFRSLGTNATASPSSGDECELTRAGRFDELSGTPSATSSLKRSRLAVHDTPKNIECKRHCCLKDPQTVLSPYTLKSTHRLLASTSSPQINAAYGIISPGQKAGANLVGDFSRAHSLPALPFSDGSNNGIARISWETLAATMRGEHSLPGKLIIIDCRYPYEFNAGHIQGAVNMSSAEAITEQLMGADAIEELKACEARGESIIPIFHCEFSVKRSVALLQHLRKTDRDLHLENYPRLYYPEMYLLSGGYKDFFSNCKVMCDPPHYVSMNDKKFSGELTRFSRSKTYSGLRSDIPRFRHRNSLKF